MAFHVGQSERQRVILDGVTYYITMLSTFVVAMARLYSSDGYILKDSNGIYLTVKEEDE